MKIILDKDSCIGCGQCINTCDEVFAFDEDGLAKVLKDEIKEENINEVEEAIDNCPAEAIKEI